MFIFTIDGTENTTFQQVCLCFQGSLSEEGTLSVGDTISMAGVSDRTQGDSRES